MKIRIPIEKIRVGDVDPKTGKKVVEKLNRTHARYIRAVLEGGWPIVDGYYGQIVEVERKGA